MLWGTFAILQPSGGYIVVQIHSGQPGRSPSCEALVMRRDTLHTSLRVPNSHPAPPRSGLSSPEKAELGAHSPFGSCPAVVESEHKSSMHLLTLVPTQQQQARPDAGLVLVQSSFANAILTALHAAQCQ